MQSQLDRLATPNDFLTQLQVLEAQVKVLQRYIEGADLSVYLLASGARTGAASQDQEFTNGIKVNGALQVVRGGTTYDGDLLAAGGKIGTVSATTLTTSWQTLVSQAVTVPMGGGFVMLWGRVHVDQNTAGGTHLEAQITLDGSTVDYTRVRSVAVDYIEYNLPLCYAGTIGAGSRTLALEARKNVNAGSFDATSDPRSVLFYALHV